MINYSAKKTFFYNKVFIISRKKIEKPTNKKKTPTIKLKFFSSGR